MMVRSSIILLFFLISCSPKVISYVSERASFSQYNTYYLLNTKKTGSASGDDITPRLEQAIKSNMGYRGYEEDLEMPDLLLRYELISSTRSEVNVTGSPYSYVGNISYRTFNESILLLELKDRKTDKLVWQASIDMRDHSDIRKKKDPLRSAVNKLFETYLYRAGQAQKDETLLPND